MEIEKTLEYHNHEREQKLTCLASKSVPPKAPLTCMSENEQIFNAMAPSSTVRNPVNLGRQSFLVSSLHALEKDCSEGDGHSRDSGKMFATYSV